MIEQLPAVDAYPNARNAVAHAEQHPNAENYWRYWRSLISPGQAVVDEEYEVAKRNGIQYAEEIKNPDFARFVAAKLGMY